MSQLSRVGHRTCTVVLEGEVDAAAWPRVRAALAPALDCACAVVAVNTSGVTFVDCAGLRPLVDVALQLRARGVRTRLPSPSAPVARLVVLTGLDRLLETGARPAPAAPGRVRVRGSVTR